MDCTILKFVRGTDQSSSHSVPMNCTTQRGKIPKIVFLSPGDPRNRRQWSGTINAIFVALQKRDGNIRFITGGILEWIGRAARKLLSLVGINLELRYSKAFGWLAGWWTSARLWTVKADAVVAVAASSYVAFLRTRMPIIYISDATFAAIERLNPEFAALPAWLRRDGNDLERRSLRRSSHIIYPSEWARRSAVEDYGMDDRIIHVMPFGPNLSRELLGQYRTVKIADFNSSVRILCVAADWKRKNGDYVLEIGRALRRAGLPCELFLVGRIPATVRSGDGVHVIGFLNKNDPAHLARLCDLYQKAHFFIMPTTIDAYGIVFSEAQAFGCPSITFDVGGTATAVLDKETGIVLPLTATAEDFARRVEELVQDPLSYETMSRNARRRYERSANWEAWAETILQLARSPLDPEANRRLPDLKTPSASSAG
jgi:glycosyltransferase involved in cell wall biosynthesis